MRVIAKGRGRASAPAPPQGRFFVRQNGTRSPKSRPARERAYTWVICDRQTGKVVAYFTSKRLADRELARRVAT